MAQGSTATFWSSHAGTDTTRIILVRHGRVSWNARAAYTGWTDVPLDERGIAEAGMVAERLKSVQVDAVYSSDLSRAKLTAEIIGKPHGLSVNTDQNLREINYGEWEGLDVDAIKERYGEPFFNSWMADPENVCVPGGESFGGLQQRVVPVLQRVADSHPGQTTVVVAHKSVNRVLLCTWLGLPAGRYREIEQLNVAINSVVFMGNRVVVETVNDVGHVD